jgi:hypothetical protein
LSTLIIAGHEALSGNSECFDLKAFLLALAKAWSPADYKDNKPRCIEGKIIVTLPMISQLCFKVGCYLHDYLDVVLPPLTVHHQLG